MLDLHKPSRRPGGWLCNWIELGRCQNVGVWFGVMQNELNERRCGGTLCCVSFGVMFPLTALLFALSAAGRLLLPPVSSPLLPSVVLGTRRVPSFDFEVMIRPRRKARFDEPCRGLFGASLDSDFAALSLPSPPRPPSPSLLLASRASPAKPRADRLSDVNDGILC
ncbi:hypothetical protein HD806DRAFT_380644 [Xylariaceae sp. AK1471]|nr:hypothetical protein HD806DRAFT_380644 [Xylariaceae sp. AK1471]